MTSDRLQRRKRERRVFVKRYLKDFQKLSKLPIRVPLDWRSYMHREEIQRIVQDARDILYYMPATDNYAIWCVLWASYEKNFKKKD